jgi:hypothetical protein
MMKFKEIRIPSKDLNRIYNYIRRESADHHVIASNILSGDHLAELGRVAALRADCPSAYLHWVLAFPQADVPKLTPELITKVWKRFFTLMEVPATCKYVVATHGADMQHSHALLSRVGTDANIWLARFTVRKGIKTTETLEKEFGLTVTPTLNYDAPSVRKPTFNKHEYEQKSRTRLPVRKEVIVSIIEESIKRSEGAFLSFIRACESQGLRACVIERANGAKGISFTYEGVSYKGSQIGKGYSYANLTKTLAAIAKGEADVQAPKRKTPEYQIQDMKALAETSSLPASAPQVQRTEAELHKRGLLERLDKLRKDCPRELEFAVTLLFFIIGARLYVPRYYFMLRQQVRWMEEESREIKAEKAKKLEIMQREWVR